MTHKIPVWLKDQHGYEYQVSLDERRNPFIEMRNYNHSYLSMADVIDKPPGHSVIWGDTTFTVTKNVYHFGVGED